LSRPVRAALGAFALVLGVGGCGSPQAKPVSQCVSGLDLECAPLFDPPLYSTLYEQILHPTCAQGRGTCHTADAAQGDLVMEDIDETYARLLGTFDQRPRVKPGDPACSLLVERLEAKTSEQRMPPGPTPLSDAARCDVVLWIAQGASR
jgi:hypothetical protein